MSDDRASVADEAAAAVLLVSAFGAGVTVQTTDVVRAAVLRLLREGRNG